MYSILNVTLPLSIEYLYRRQHNSHNDIKNTLVGHSSQILESSLQLPISGRVHGPQQCTC